MATEINAGNNNLWVVIPTFNEAENIEQILRAILALELNLNIVVVDDSSPDGTGRIAENLAENFNNIHVLHRPGGNGLGTAYMGGFWYALQAGAEAVLTMDCDFSHDPQTIPSLISALETADVVIGSRYVTGGRIENWGVHRKILSASANLFVRSLFGLPVRDCTSGFRIYRKRILENIPWHLTRSTGYSFLVETLCWATRQKPVVVKEVPICFVDREQGVSKMSSREIFHGMGNLLRFRSALSKKMDFPSDTQQQALKELHKHSFLASPQIVTETKT